MVEPITIIVRCSDCLYRLVAEIHKDYGTTDTLYIEPCQKCISIKAQELNSKKQSTQPTKVGYKVAE